MVSHLDGKNCECYSIRSRARCRLAGWKLLHQQSPLPCTLPKASLIAHQPGVEVLAFLMVDACGPSPPTVQSALMNHFVRSFEGAALGRLGPAHDGEEFPQDHGVQGPVDTESSLRPERSNGSTGGGVE